MIAPSRAHFYGFVSGLSGRHHVHAENQGRHAEKVWIFMEGFRYEQSRGRHRMPSPVFDKQIAVRSTSQCFELPDGT